MKIHFHSIVGPDVFLEWGSFFDESVHLIG